MKPTTHIDSPAFNRSPPLVGTGAEHHEDWSDIWALEDPAISGAVPIDQIPSGKRETGEFH